MQFIYSLKIHQADIVIFECHQNTHWIRNRIVGFLHDHVFYLAHEVIFLGFGGVCRYHTSNYNIRMKIVSHNVCWEIIVDPSVICQHIVNLYRLKHKGKAHGSSDGISQISVSHYELLFIVYIRSYASERNEQLVEIAFTRSCSACIQIYKNQIHLYGIYYACGQKLWFEVF